MRIVTVSLVSLAIASAIQACPPAPAPPTPDAGDSGAADASPPPPPLPDASTPARAACANLAAAGCPEGQAGGCAASLDRAISMRLANVDLVCLTTKHTKAELRACGFVSCP